MTSTDLSRAHEALRLHRAHEALRLHIAACARDKYNRPAGMFDVQAQLTGPHAKTINLFAAAKYLTRYESAGYEKSGQREDLMKAIHHLLIQLNNEL